MATHSSTIAWRIPWIGEPGRHICLHININIYIYNEKYNDSLYLSHYRYGYSFPSCAAVKNPPANAEGATDVSSIPGMERYPGVGNGNLL